MMMTDFYNEIYENLYANHGYHASDALNSTHYPVFFTACLTPSQIEYESVLDVGCSTGIGIKSFFEPLGKVCEGVDVSKTAVEKANGRGVKAQVASITDLPFEDNSFDLVCSTDVVEHLRPEDQEKAHRECFRVSKKYVAHMICNTREGNKFNNQTLHLTVQGAQSWYDYFEHLNLEEWELVYKMTPELYAGLKDDIRKAIDFPGVDPFPTFDVWNARRTVVIFEKKG